MPEQTEPAKFHENEIVKVKSSVPGPNRRTPRYLQGRTGMIVGSHGVVPDYAFDHPDDWGRLYSVSFDLDALTREKVVADIHESWLERAPERDKSR